MSKQELLQYCSDLLNDIPVAHARATDPATSKAAAASVTRIRESQETILYLLKTCGPMSDESIYARVSAGMSPSGARTRRSELVTMGRVKDSGRREKTKAGRQTIVWQACS